MRPLLIGISNFLEEVYFQMRQGRDVQVTLKEEHVNFTHTEKPGEWVTTHYSAPLRSQNCYSGNSWLRFCQFLFLIFLVTPTACGSSASQQ